MPSTGPYKNKLCFSYFYLWLIKRSLWDITCIENSVGIIIYNILKFKMYNNNIWITFCMSFMNHIIILRGIIPFKIRLVNIFHRIYLLLGSHVITIVRILIYIILKWINYIWIIELHSERFILFIFLSELLFCNLILE